MSAAVRRASDDGSVLVEYVLVAILVVIIALGVVQLALALHVRNMLISAASEGARLAAAHDQSLDDGERRTAALIEASLGGYPAQIDSAVESAAGGQVVAVSVTAPVPMFGLWGVRTLTVDGHALKEVDRG